MTEPNTTPTAAPETATPEVVAQAEAGGAVDTGRRVDPAKLVRGKNNTMRRTREDAPKGEADAQAKAEGSTEERADGAKRGRDGGRGKRDGRDGHRGSRDGKREGRDGRRGGKGRRDDRRGEKQAKPERAPRGPVYAEKIERPEPTSFDATGDFAAMLDAAGPIETVRLGIGDAVQAELIHVGSDTAFFALGSNQEGVMALAELLDGDGNLTANPGDSIKAFVVNLRGGITLSKKIGRHGADTDMLEQAKESGIPVEGKVEKLNNGGFEVTVAGARAFCPIGQIAIGFVEDGSSFVGQTLTFAVTEVSEGGRRVVVSRRRLLEAERAEKREATMAKLEVGLAVTGTISRLADFGAFVDLGGVDGLIPISELSYARVGHPSEVVKEGQEVRVEVLRIEDNPKRPNEKRIALSLKKASTDPWVSAPDTYSIGQSFDGTVNRVADFGAFVELEPGVDGLVHISQLSHERVRHPSDVVSVGDKVSVRVLDLDPSARRISLTLKAQRDEPAKGALPRRGDRFDAVVERIESYGVFVKLTDGVSALLPASETGTPRGSDLRKAFPQGSTVSVSVIDIDDRDRVRVSKIARERAEEADVVKKYQGAQKKGGMGTFGDLFANIKL